MRSDAYLNGMGVYQGSFWARSLNEGDEIDVVLLNGEEPYDLLFLQHYVLTEDWQEYTFSFTTMQDYHGLFKLDIGYQTGTLFFDKFDLHLEKPCIPGIIDPDNIIRNGYFDQCNLDAWILFQVYSENSTGNMTLEEGTCSISDITISEEPVSWYIQLMQFFSESQRNRLKKDSIYILSFEASSTKEDRPMYVYLGLDEAPNTTLIYEEVDLSTSLEEYFYEFPYTAIMPSLRLSFELGMDTSSVIIDKINLVRKKFDEDNDGIEDHLDNCPSIANVGQEDTDSDDIGNACDNCPDSSNPDQNDTDGDGIGDICEETSALEVLKQNEEMKIFPNPATDVVNILSVKPASLILYNSTGCVIKKILNEKRIQSIPVNNLPDGFYFMEVKTGLSSTYLKLLVKHEN
ncbi:MAG: carbohydrate binding domain-containing protein [Bacteroidales bacterium]|nr:carbohydrate binding domain-containing protein [Bacteroidales bacterium]